MCWHSMTMRQHAAAVPTAVKSRVCRQAATGSGALYAKRQSHSLTNFTCLTLVNRPWPISRPPDATSTEPSGYTCTLAAMAGGEQSNLRMQEGTTQSGAETGNDMRTLPVSEQCSSCTYRGHCAGRVETARKRRVQARQTNKAAVAAPRVTACAACRRRKLIKATLNTAGGHIKVMGNM